MKKGFFLLFLCGVLCLLVSGCGHSSEGSSAIIGGGTGGTPEGGGTFGTLKWSTSIRSTPSGTAGSVFTPTFISSPAIAPDGTIYVGSDDHFLYALKPDGTVKWKYETANSLFASPAIGSDGTVYICSEDRQIYALNPDGTLRWIVATDADFTSSPSIAADGTIYCAGTNQDKTVFTCANIGTCSVTKTTSCSLNSDCPAGETCVLGTSVTVQLSRLFAINPDGSIKWVAGQFNQPLPGVTPLNTPLSGVVHSSPAVAGDGTIYIGSEGDFSFDRTDKCDPKSIFPSSDADSSAPAGGHLYAFKPDGTLKWDFKMLGHVDSSPALAADGTVYVGSDGQLKLYGKDPSTLLDQNPSTEGFLTAINPDGTLKCLQNLLGNVKSSPAVGTDGTIYVGSDDKHIWALFPNCAVKWVFPTRDKVRSSAAIATDGTIYIGSNDGSLYALNADGTLKNRFDSEGAVNSSPSIGGNGTIYFASASARGDNVNSSKLNAVVGNSGLAESPWPKFRRDLPNTGRQ